MSEMLAHPWLESATPGILYVLAPPVSELARPLPSALHIDRDLFESLCVIWGRHADTEGIRADLLSPAGHGTLAKAFYFLLQKHREKAMEEHGILMDIDGVLNTQGKVILKQYAAPRSKPGNRQSMEVDPTTAPSGPHTQHLRSDRPAPQPPSRTPSPKPPLAITTSVPMERAPSRPRPQSPVGPRPQKPKPQAPSVRNTIAFSNPPSFVPNPDMVRARYQRTSPGVIQRPHRTAKSEAALRFGPPPMQRNGVSAPPAHRASMHESTYVPYGQSSRQGAVSAPGVIFAPRPVPAAVPTIPALTTPRISDVEMQMDVDPTTALDAQSLPWPPTHMQSARASRQVQFPHDAVPRRQARMSSTEHRMDVAWDRDARHENKENATRQPSARPAHSECQSGGLGFHSLPLGKEMGNMVFIQEATNGQQAKKDKKARRE